MASSTNRSPEVPASPRSLSHPSPHSPQLSILDALGAIFVKNDLDPIATRDRQEKLRLSQQDELARQSPQPRSTASPQPHQMDRRTPSPSPASSEFAAGVSRQPAVVSPSALPQQQKTAIAPAAVVSAISPVLQSPTTTAVSSTSSFSSHQSPSKSAQSSASKAATPLPAQPPTYAPVSLFQSPAGQGKRYSMSAALTNPAVQHREDTEATVYEPLVGTVGKMFEDSTVIEDYSLSKESQQQPQQQQSQPHHIKSKSETPLKLNTSEQAPPAKVGFFSKLTAAITPSSSSSAAKRQAELDAAAQAQAQEHSQPGSSSATPSTSGVTGLFSSIGSIFKSKPKISAEAQPATPKASGSSSSSSASSSSETAPSSFFGFLSHAHHSPSPNSSSPLGDCNTDSPLNSESKDSAATADPAESSAVYLSHSYASLPTLAELQAVIPTVGSFEDFFDPISIRRGLRWRNTLNAEGLRKVFAKNLYLKLLQTYENDANNPSTPSSANSVPEQQQQQQQEVRTRAAAVSSEESALSTCEYVSRKIQKDLHRTFPAVPLFQLRYTRQLLYNILASYAAYDAAVAYSQGMAFVVGTLIVHFGPPGQPAATTSQEEPTASTPNNKSASASTPSSSSTPISASVTAADSVLASAAASVDAPTTVLEDVNGITSLDAATTPSASSSALVPSTHASSSNTDFDSLCAISAAQHEELLFWTFVQMMHSPKHNLRAFYTDDCIGLKNILHLFEQTLLLMDKPLHTHLQQCGVEVSFFATSWFITIYSMRFTSEFASAVMDHFINVGAEFLLQIGIQILLYTRQSILSKRSFDQLMPFLTQLPELPNSLPDRAFHLDLPKQILTKLNPSHTHVNSFKVRMRTTSEKCTRLRKSANMNGKYVCCSMDVCCLCLLSFYVE